VEETDAELRYRAAARVTEQPRLREIAAKSEDRTVLKHVLSRIEDQQFLLDLADSEGAVRRAAVLEWIADADSLWPRACRAAGGGAQERDAGKRAVTRCLKQFSDTDRVLRAAQEAIGLGLRDAASWALTRCGQPAIPALVALAREECDAAIEGLGKIPSADSIDALLRLLFGKPRDSSRPHPLKRALSQLQPHSCFSAEEMKVVFSAASWCMVTYVQDSSGTEWTQWPDTTESEAAVKWLCGQEGTGIVNVLHLIGTMSDGAGRMMGSTHEFNIETDRLEKHEYSSGHVVRFAAHRHLAEAELERKGRPPYDVAAYTRQSDGNTTA
jgi:hypothetical protein